MKRIPLIILLLCPTMATLHSQPDFLNGLNSGIETRYHLYETKWVCLGDTLATDTTESDGIICLVDGFWIFCNEVTQDFWEWYMHYNPSAQKGSLLPVTNITADGTDSLCRQIYLSIRQQWRLPTREEWLFACKGGLFGEGYRYAGSNNPMYIAWTAENSNGSIHHGGLLIPNELGLYDMDGNVAEPATDGNRIIHMGGCCIDRPETLNETGTDTPPQYCGLRLVKHEAVWFDKYGQRIFRNDTNPKE